MELKRVSLALLLGITAHAEKLWFVQMPSNPSADINVFAKQILMTNAAFTYRKMREFNPGIDRPLKKVESFNKVVNSTINSTVDKILPSIGQKDEQAKFKFKLWLNLENATVFTETLLLKPKLYTTSNIIYNTNNIKLNIYDTVYFDINSTLQFNNVYYGLALIRGWD